MSNGRICDECGRAEKVAGYDSRRESCALPDTWAIVVVSTNRATRDALENTRDVCSTICATLAVAKMCAIQQIDNRNAPPQPDTVPLERLDDTGPYSGGAARSGSGY